MDPKFLHILQHSLGCDQYGQGSMYRNYFFTGPGTTDFPLCQALVECGYMQDGGPQRMSGGNHVFRVTEEGIRQMRANSPKPPRLTPGQRRYQEFLDADCGMTFIEFLKASAKLKREGSAFA